MADLRTRAFVRTTSALPNPFSSFKPGKVTSRRHNAANAHAQAASTAPSPLANEPVRVDVLAWFARATLDVIGEAGFGYHFNSVATAAHKADEKTSKDENELAQAFGVIFASARQFRVMTILQAWFPELRRFVSVASIV